MRYSQLSQIQSDLDGGLVTVPEIVGYYLSNIDQKKHLNAFLSVFKDEALQRAALVQEKYESGKAGQLAGLVLAIKDVLCLKDHSLECGSKILEGFKSQYTATAVQRLLDEDAIIIGRLNCDEFAMGSSNENSAFGPCLNPIDNERVPGGSSGGSAAAVAADLCLAALGTDTGGSVRQPASFCNVIGLKPTYSRISRYGLAAYASSFDTIGTVTHSINDASLLLRIMAGHDSMDSTSSKEAVEDYTQTDGSSSSFRIAVVDYDIDGVDDSVKDIMAEQVAHLKTLGYTVNKIKFDSLEFALPTYYILTTAEASTNLSRYDGIRYGHRSKADDLTSTYKESRNEGFGDEVKRRILLGTFVLSSNYYDAYYAKAQKVRRIISDQLKGIFEEYDFIMLPTAPTPPFKIGEHNNSLEMYLADLFTVPASVAGVPAISLPLGQSKNGLPIGVQFMSDHFTEHKLLSFSKNLLNDSIITS